MCKGSLFSEKVLNISNDNLMLTELNLKNITKYFLILYVYVLFACVSYFKMRVCFTVKTGIKV